MGQGPNESGLSRCHVQISVESSRRRPQTDTIDVLYAHGWEPFTPLDEVLRTFDDLMSAGKVRFVGVSNFKAWQVMKALGGSFLSDKYQPSQRPTRASEGRLAVTPDAREESWRRRSTEQNWRILETVNTKAAAHPGVTPSQVALSWSVAQNYR